MAHRYPLAKRLSWRLEYFSYQLFEKILQPISLPLTDRFGSFIGLIFYYLSPKYRRLLVRNLRIAFGRESSRSEINQLARHTCQRTIANFFSTLKTTLLSTAEIDRYITVEGATELHETLASGKGAILVLGHMGNWEILNRLHQHLPPGTRAGGIYQPLKNPLVDALMLRRREQDGSRLFNKRDGFHGPANFVKEGGLLIVVADQRTEKSGVPIPFFGRLSALSPLPAMLARKADSPVFAAGISSTKPGYWSIILRPIGIRPDTSTIIAHLQSLILRSPADYLWLHNRWKLARHHPLSTNLRKAKSTAPPTSPAEVLILTQDNVDQDELEKFQRARHPSDLPLSFTIIQTVDVESDLHSDSILLLASPTQEQLTAQIKSLSEQFVSPFELALVLAPNPTFLKAAKKAQIPRIEANKLNLPLTEFLTSLSFPSPSAKS